MLPTIFDVIVAINTNKIAIFTNLNCQLELNLDLD